MTFLSEIVDVRDPRSLTILTTDSSAFSLIFTKLGQDDCQLHGWTVWTCGATRRRSDWRRNMRGGRKVSPACAVDSFFLLKLARLSNMIP